MIYLTKLNSDIFMVNNELIETIEETPDTVITMTTGKKFLVKESCQEILKKVIEFKQKIYTKLN